MPDRLPMRRLLPAERTSVEPRPPALPPNGEVAFVLFGYNHPDGTSLAVGSRKVIWAEVQTDYITDNFREQTIRAKLHEVIMARGFTLAEAIALLMETW